MRRPSDNRKALTLRNTAVPTALPTCTGPNGPEPDDRMTPAPLRWRTHTACRSCLGADSLQDLREAVGDAEPGAVVDDEMNHPRSGQRPSARSPNSPLLVSTAGLAATNETNLHCARPTNGRCPWHGSWCRPQRWSGDEFVGRGVNRHIVGCTADRRHPTTPAPTETSPRPPTLTRIRIEADPARDLLLPASASTRR